MKNNSVVAVPETSAYEGVVFNLTGFGAFGTVKTNPTSIMIEHLKEIKAKGLDGTDEFPVKLGHLTVLNVAAEDCNVYLQETLKLIEAQTAANPKIKQVHIHFGVYAGSQHINLELHAYNFADFRIPDNRGWQPRGHKICSTLPLEHYFKTTLPAEGALGALPAEFKSLVKLSTDPGRYICNYVFYASLLESLRKDVATIFIHVPLFDAIPQEMQLKIITTLMIIFSEYYKNQYKDASKRA
eukprot:TRINITY_DN4993_c0_g2_i11.p2 TRINITY_DN4993_c0_g2~~TRINITY_DN4993_c0_g2_i11.p2  ORF type:complete len:241 (-),score=60.56 TRINITY_DN4993_c0_g2_i11:218-940(-)